MHYGKGKESEEEEKMEQRKKAVMRKTPKTGVFCSSCAA